MSQPIPTKAIEKAIIKGAKKVIAESPLNPSTQSGNKELSHWATSLAKQPFSSLESAQQFGETLGQKIVELSEQTHKTHLDGGVIRQLRSQKGQPALSETTPAATPAKSEPKPTQPAPTAPEPAVPDEEPAFAEEITLTEDPMTESTPSQPEIVSIPVEKPQSTEEAASVAAIEDEDVIPADPELAKVHIDPNPEEKTAAEEPKSVVETVAQAKVVSDDDTAAPDINQDHVAEVIESEKEEVTSADQ